jgi:hypothetical protein
MVSSLARAAAREPSEKGRRRRPIARMPTRHASGAGPHRVRFGDRPHPIFFLDLQCLLTKTLLFSGLEQNTSFNGVQ